MHPEKVVSRGFRTGVRLPSGPPKQKKPFGAFLFWLTLLMRGIERSEQNNPVSCFANGDRRFLRDVTLDKIPNVEQKSRTTPRGDTIQSHEKWEITKIRLIASLSLP